MRRWTSAEREKQAQLIQLWRPWECSTGPKTFLGKTQSSKNSFKHGAYDAETRATEKFINECKKISLKLAI